MKRFFSILLAFAFIFSTLFSTLASADEGMWLYNAPPKDKIKAKYGFELTQEWLDHVRLSSVRFNNGGSGSFVSADGLTFTNHHVGAGCVQQLSTEGHDYIKTGFYAKTQAEEAKCPNLELNQLVGIEDVTDKINAGVKPDMSAAEAGQAQRAAMSQVEKDCTTATGLRCDVVTFYSGQVYNLYKYKKYTDVRLVFAPEFDMAFFGGDPDNFTYPRYDLDITFFRVYENDKPAHLDHYLKWSRTGVKDGDLIFVSGHPGNTGRLLTMAQLGVPAGCAVSVDARSCMLAASPCCKTSASSRKRMPASRKKTFSACRTRRRPSPAISRDCSTSRSWMRRPPTKPSCARRSRPIPRMPERRSVGRNCPSDQAAAVDLSQPDLPRAHARILLAPGPDSAGSWCARPRRKPKPNQDRMREFRDSALPSLEQQLFSTEPIYKNLDIALLTDSLTEMQDALGKDNPDVQKVLQGKTPAEAAKDLITNTKLDDVAVRKQLYEGGQAAIDASTDPLIVADACD